MITIIWVFRNGFFTTRYPVFSLSVRGHRETNESWREVDFALVMWLDNTLVTQPAERFIFLIF